MDLYTNGIKSKTPGGEILVLSEELTLRMKSHAGETYPKECCGLMFGFITDDGVTVVQESVCIDNRDRRKDYHFRIEPMEIYKHEKEQKEKGLDILGFYHSHPDRLAIPSDEAIREMIPGPVYLIMSAFAGGHIRLRAWRRDPDSGLIRELRILHN